jgi:hypothetical protein
MSRIIFGLLFTSFALISCSGFFIRAYQVYLFAKRIGKNLFFLPPFASGDLTDEERSNIWKGTKIMLLGMTGCLLLLLFAIVTKMKL